jgi:2-methylcitrate dehydratase PrpD
VETLALAARVAVREDPALTARLPGLRPARLRVLLRDGTVREAAVETNRGDTEDPYETADIVAKFHELADPVWGAAHAARVADAVMALDTAPNLAALHALLAGDSL